MSGKGSPKGSSIDVMSFNGSLEDCVLGSSYMDSSLEENSEKPMSKNNLIEGIVEGIGEGISKGIGEALKEYFFQPDAAYDGVEIRYEYILSIDHVIDFLKSRTHRKDEEIAFTMQQKLRNRSYSYKTMAGIFNKSTGEFAKDNVVIWYSHEIDAALTDYHRNDELVIYT